MQSFHVNERFVDFDLSDKIDFIVNKFNYFVK